MSKTQENELLDIAEALESTLGDMGATEADEVVATQADKIYKLLGYKVIKRKSKQSGVVTCILYRKDVP